MRRDIRLRALAVTVALVAAAGAALVWFDRDAPRQAGSNFDTAFEQAVLLLHARQYEPAAAALHALLQRSPQVPELHVNMGYALLGLKNYAAARDFFLGAIRLRPSQANAYYGLAEALEGTGDLRGAIEAMRTYVHLRPAEDEFARKANAAIWEWQAAMKGGAK
ncbi:MAG TPA: tetratricopeptide repeat protein [Burkholderiales bacterium]